MKLQRELNNLIEKEKDIIPFLKALDDSQKKELLPFIKNKKEELFKWKSIEKKSSWGGSTYTSNYNSTDKQRNLIYRAGCVCSTTKAEF